MFLSSKQTPIHHTKCYHFSFMDLILAYQAKSSADIDSNLGSTSSSYSHADDAALADELAQEN